MTKSERSTLVSSVGEGIRFLSCRFPSLGGESASDTNKVIFLRCVESWLFLIEDLMLRQCLGDDARDARRGNFLLALASTDIVETLSFLESLYLLLLEDTTDLETFKQFLDTYGSKSGDYRRLLSPINRSLYPFLTETDKEMKAHFLSSIAQFLRFPRKLEFQDIGLEAQALEGYLETEKLLETVNYDEISETLDGLAQIIVDWFGDFHIESLRPSHGPGSVAEGSLTLTQKFGEMRTDKILRILLSQPSEPLMYQEFFPDPPGEGLQRISKTIFVPKTATKLRTISMEPATLQYIQQGVMYELYQYIERHPVLGVHVRLRDQTQNQIWALIGSRDRSYGTIDLSHASDSVSWDLVRRVFRRVPRLYRWLLGTRSRQTLLPDGTLLRLKKFAPMGSALCFPIECIIFSAVVEYASRKAARLSRSGFDPFWTVYGDDIVVSSHIYEDVVDILTSLGFVVNKTKSYNRGCYRESCGKEYYAGVDVTPLYYSTPYYKKRMSPGALGSWLSSANNAYLSRLPLYRWHLIQKVLSFSSRRKPYFTDNPMKSPYVYSPQPTNFHVRKKWNGSYQRYEGRFISVLSKPRDGELDDERLAYFIRLVEMSKRPKDLPTRRDVSPVSHALNGCVEIFSSTTLPLVPFKDPSRVLAWDW